MSKVHSSKVSTKGLKELDAALAREAHPARYLESHRKEYSKTSVVPDFWVRLVLQYLIDGRETDAKTELETRSARIMGISRKHVGLADAIYLAYTQSDLLGMRSATERFSQRNGAYVTSILPTLLSKLDRKVIDRETRLDAEPYDYSVTSYSQWLHGLELVASGEFEEGRKRLLDSLHRYAVGNMAEDVCWSWFDSIVASLLLDDLVGAHRLYDAYLQLAAGTPFQQLSAACLEAYEKRDYSVIERARLLFARMHGDFSKTSYPRIFDRLAHHVTSRTASAPAVTHPVTKRERQKPSYTLLKCEPAREADVDILARIAGYVNLGNTRPTSVKDHFKMSADTLAGALTWRQGLVFFATRARLEDGSWELIGSCKLQLLVDECWRKISRKRNAHRGKRVAEYDLLQFDNTDSKGLELAGNVVSPEFRRQGVGTFHTQARLLFVQMYELPEIETLFADLLTTSDNDGYPFYEHVVKPMLGNLSYDEADDLRYSDREAVADLLGSVRGSLKGVGGAAEIPLHVLPSEIVKRFGVVREETIGAKRILERYGFRRSEKFDLLDGGQFYSLRVDDLHRMPIFRKLVLAESRVSDAEQLLFSLAPTKRAMPDFQCIRAPGHIDENSLVIPQDVLIQSGLRTGEEVLIVVDAPPTRADL